MVALTAQELPGIIPGLIRASKQLFHEGYDLLHLIPKPQGFVLLRAPEILCRR